MPSHPLPTHPLFKSFLPCFEGMKFLVTYHGLVPCFFLLVLPNHMQASSKIPQSSLKSPLIDLRSISILLNVPSCAFMQFFLPPSQQNNFYPSASQFFHSFSLHHH
eukprot:TRINITY_DN109001_c0_g1_i1.p1 TRINITY_DN109001_c0_g1~~TRINITY_DN109001_c0_g1_i1.p1  ORF type:complete len:106 (+),score=10.43 TRINITY_DN109001_c0_g1_i1:176-493(+)